MTRLRPASRGSPAAAADEITGTDDGATQPPRPSRGRIKAGSSVDQSCRFRPDAAAEKGDTLGPLTGPARQGVALRTGTGGGVGAVWTGSGRTGCELLVGTAALCDAKSEQGTKFPEWFTQSVSAAADRTDNGTHDRENTLPKERREAVPRASAELGPIYGSLLSQQRHGYILRKRQGRPPYRVPAVTPWQNRVAQTL